MLTRRATRAFISPPSDPTPDGVPEVEVRGRSLWADATARFMRNRAAVAGAVVLAFLCLFAFAGQLLTPWDNETIDWGMLGQVSTLGGPSLETGHWFGVDETGRDLYARTVQGTRISLAVGIIGALVAVGIGTVYGAVAGYVGGRADDVMMRLVDVLIAVPYMFVLILLMVVFERSVVMLFVGVGLISWLDMARIVRGQTLTLKNREFVEAAIATGVRTPTIIGRHIVPNLLGIVVVYASLLVPSMILLESFISFLGLGVQEPQTSLGALIAQGASQMRNDVPWMLGFPLALFVILLFALFFVGDGLRDALDPKDR
jgi:oligopeptide transport system permease protein